MSSRTIFSVLILALLVNSAFSVVFMSGTSTSSTTRMIEGKNVNFVTVTKMAATAAESTWTRTASTTNIDINGVLLAPTVVTTSGTGVAPALPASSTGPLIACPAPVSP